MATARSETSSIPTWWIVLFLLLALGAGGFAVLTVGGSLVSTPAGFVMPAPF